MKELRDWDDVKLLSVKVDRLRKWYREGLLCIGDSAHAMSPVGGVGINLAIQNAVAAAANFLAPKLRAGPITLDDLKAVQDRRLWPTRMTQRTQILLHKHFLEPIFRTPKLLKPPLFLRLFQWIPMLQRIPARMIGLGFRPEHVNAVPERDHS